MLWRLAELKEELAKGCLKTAPTETLEDSKRAGEW